MLVRSLHAYWSLWLNGVNFNSKQVQGGFREEFSRSIRIFIFICQIGAFQNAHSLYDMTESYVDFLPVCPHAGARHVLINPGQTETRRTPEQEHEDPDDRWTNPGGTVPLHGPRL